MEGRGIALIKPEFIQPDHVPTLVLDCISTEDKEHLLNKNNPLVDEDQQPIKKFKRTKKDVLKGQNKNRGPTFRQNKNVQLCPKLVDCVSSDGLPVCDNERCSFMHDPLTYIASKPTDIADQCYVFDTYGFCPRGLTCRFGKSHITEDGKNIKKCDTISRSSSNYLSKELQHKLRKRTYNFQKSEKTVDSFDQRNKKVVQSVLDKSSCDTECSSETSENIVHSFDQGYEEVVENVLDVASCDTECSSETSENIVHSFDQGNEKVVENVLDVASCDRECSGTTRLGYADDHDIIKLRPAEKKMILWDGKLILSPLTTVGNLPFRRICKEFGADVTCGEMALASSLLQGKAQEWALVRRHETEDIFGVQVCGNNPYVMTKCAQLLQENINVDFVDVNLGCPIDLVYKQGAGSGMLRRERILINTLKSMSHVLDVPLTAKTRTGVYKDQRVAHTLIPRFVDCGLSLISIHGRTREQRYTKSADWDYIEECAKLAGDVPVFGNGDVLSYIDYNENLEKCPHVKGVLLARGALYKPWLFTEIKEQRLWDISSAERMDIIRKYVNYGLEHWGSDNKGVENTRRFLLEWLSFLHRYIPVGLLERPPQKINERPPVYRGRDELETLFASPNCRDWIKISEMLLGPVPEGFNFLPKHKASSWK